MTRLLSILAILCLSLPPAHAIDTCSRVAIINYQEVLVDTNSTQKGEGLRYYLEKDPVAKNYLDIYQQGTQIRWQNAILGSVGTGLVLAGLLAKSGSTDKQSLLIGGVGVIAVNFLIAKTLESANEVNLVNAIDEYNKRNLPKIYFNPGLGGFGDKNDAKEVYIEKSWGF